mmetsp:Transcript_22904/g.49984  ORF Transcript_22904/g.49984 Transcript_22904/m.49984 type:complete len:295 (+) Transcript_22904:35-919(+)
MLRGWIFATLFMRSSLVLKAAGKLQLGPLPPAGFWETRMIIKKSRFIARLGACSTLEEAKDFRAMVCDPKANHNCCAARSRGGELGSSDDGEPAGTAGMPMRAVLEGSHLFGAIVVVTRYFGGIKLGTGGLVRAYSALTRAVLEEAQLEEMVEGLTLRVRRVPAAQVSSLYRCTGQLGDVHFAADGTAEAELWVPHRDLNEVRKELMALGSQVEIEEGDPGDQDHLEDAETEELLEDSEESEAFQDEALEQWNELLAEEHMEGRGATAVTAVLTTSEACWDISPRLVVYVSIAS